MKQILLLLWVFISFSGFGQKLKWIPFDWQGDTISGRYFDKASITIPVTIDNLPHRFNMQLDLGAGTTNIYGNSIEPYLKIHPELKNKIDTSLTFLIQGQTNFKFRDIDLKLGSVSFGAKDIGCFKNFGDKIPVDSISNLSEKHIGTIAPDLFQGKILIIDYPNKRICVTTKLPKQFRKASFQPYNGGKRIKIPLVINDKQEYLMFDTGSSIFALLTTEEKANQISSGKIIDSLNVSSWGQFYMFYGKQVTCNVKYGNIQLAKVNVYYDRANIYGGFYEQEKIWGLTGNAYFLNNVVIVDYINKRFGVH